MAEQGVKGGGSGRRPKKKVVTSPIFMAEVAIEVPKGTLDGCLGIQDVFKSL